MDVELVLDARAELARGAVWDAGRARLVFVDVTRGTVHEFDPATGQDAVIDVGQPLGCVGLSARGDWIVAARDGFYRVNPDTGRVHQLASVEAANPENRMNDGAVDAAGRFWAGTMSTTGKRRAGSLYRLDADGSVTPKVTGVTTSNGIDWSPDGRLMFYVDTGSNRIDVFNFDVDRGELTGRRPFVFVPTLAGKPDGLVVDAEGCVWLALWKGGALHRYAPAGQLTRVVKLPASLVTKCAFGGPDLTDLYVTTARGPLTEDERARQPGAGGVFRLRPGVAGRPAARFGT